MTDEQGNDSGASTDCQYLNRVIYDESYSLEAQDNAVEELRGMAEGGDPHAQYLMGKLYLEGRDIPQDKELAVCWLTESGG